MCRRTLPCACSSFYGERRSLNSGKFAKRNSAEKQKQSLQVQCALAHFRRQTDRSSVWRIPLWTIDTFFFCPCLVSRSKWVEETHKSQRLHVSATKKRQQRAQGASKSSWCFFLFSHSCELLKVLGPFKWARRENNDIARSEPACYHEGHALLQETTSIG